MQETKQITSYKQSLRDRILDTVIQAFAERGIKAVRMDDVAHTLGISKRTLYEIFDTKETVIFEGIKRHNQLKDEEISRYAKDPSHDVLDIIIHLYRISLKESGGLPPSFYEDLFKYPQIVTYMEQKRVQQKQSFLKFMRRGVEEGFFRSDINYELVSHQFEALRRYLRDTRLYEKYTFEELFFNLLFVTLRGFSTPKGIKKLDLFFDGNRK